MIRERTQRLARNELREAAWEVAAPHFAGAQVEAMQRFHDLLKPLIRETADKMEMMSPLSAQTGPAVRNDTCILEEHLRLLAEDPGMEELYRQISKSIITFARKKN